MTRAYTREAILVMLKDTLSTQKGFPAASAVLSPGSLPRLEPRSPGKAVASFLSPQVILRFLERSVKGRLALLWAPASSALSVLVCVSAAMLGGWGLPLCSSLTS